METDLRFGQWLEDLEKRHFADLRFSDVSRALRALSSAYVERRASGLGKQRDLDGVGKRAAFALYYGPLHFLLIQAIVRALDDLGRGDPSGSPPNSLVVDLGCGTGAAGAAFATTTRAPSAVTAIDSHPWALDEARLTYRIFGLTSDVRRGDVARAQLPSRTSHVVAAFVANELTTGARELLRDTLLKAAQRGVGVLIVEPISLRVSPWWMDWAAAFAAVGGRADEWRFNVQLPTIVKRLARATGLHPEVMTARTIFLRP